MTKFVKLLIHSAKDISYLSEKIQGISETFGWATMFVDSNLPPWRSSRSVVRTSDLELGGL